MDERCETCRFWQEIRPWQGLPQALSTRIKRKGHCRRYAPKPFVPETLRQRVRLAIWPEVYPEAWCGEWQAKGSDGAS